MTNKFKNYLFLINDSIIVMITDRLEIFLKLIEFSFISSQFGVDFSNLRWYDLL